MTTTTAATAPLTTLGKLAFVKAYSQATTDSTGTKAIADIARIAGSTYLAAAERASALSYAQRAFLAGPMNAARVALI